MFEKNLTTTVSSATQEVTITRDGTGTDNWKLYQNGEHFGCPPYRLDARAAFWSAWDEEGLYCAAEVRDDGATLQLGRTETVAEDVPTSYLFNTFGVDRTTGRLLFDQGHLYIGTSSWMAAIICWNIADPSIR